MQKFKSMIPGSALLCLLPLALSAQPNFIFFIPDDVDLNQVGVSGGNVYTPHLDKLAEDGIFFEQAYVNATVCTPSRYNFTTGRYASRSTYSNHMNVAPAGEQRQPTFKVGLEQDGTNIGKVLADNGYVTGWVGKFHMGADDLHFTQEGTESENEFFTRMDMETRDYIKSLGFTWAKNTYEGNLVQPLNHHNLEWTIEAALEFITDNKDVPFYLHFNTTLLHGPDGEWERSLDFPTHTGEGIVTRDLLAEMPDRSTIKTRIEDNGYNLDENPVGITWMDDGVGAILAKLDELDIANNTVVVFMPDHGSENKASMINYNGLNVPLIIRYPDGITAGQTSSSLVQGLDLSATFFELAGVELPPEYVIDGRSLTPFFQNENAQVHQSLFFELGDARAVIQDNFKYIAVRYTRDRTDDILNTPNSELTAGVLLDLYYLGSHGGVSSRGLKYNSEYLSPDQLYDLTNDPGELNNLVTDPDYAQKFAEMRALLKTHLLGLGAPFGEFIPGPNATEPDEQVMTYIRNIQNALENGATIDREVLECSGNCVINSTTSISIEGCRTEGNAAYSWLATDHNESLCAEDVADVTNIRVPHPEFKMVGNSRLQITGEGKYTVKVFNISGGLSSELKRVPPGTHNLPRLKPGVYFIQITIQNKGYSLKHMVM